MAKGASKRVSTTEPQPEQSVEVTEQVMIDDTVQKTKKTKKAKVVPELVAEVETEVVEVVPEVVAEVVAETVDVPTDVPVVVMPFNNSLIKLNEFGKRINDLTIILSSLKLEYKMLEKGLGKDIKIAQKSLSKGKRGGGLRKQTGFVKPTLISDELAKFINVEPGTEIGRIPACKEVHNYIKTNNLNKGRIIHPDEALAKLLNYTEGVSPVLSYLNLQTFIKHHFIGNKPVEVVV